MGVVTVKSLPVRGAWVEIVSTDAPSRLRRRRSLCGERGLKYGVSEKQVEYATGRSPCGERGLKFLPSDDSLMAMKASLPVRGAWVEMVNLFQHQRNLVVAPRAGSVG